MSAVYGHTCFVIIVQIKAIFYYVSLVFIIFLEEKAGHITRDEDYQSFQ